MFEVECMYVLGPKLSSAFSTAVRPCPGLRLLQPVGCSPPWVLLPPVVSRSESLVPSLRWPLPHHVPLGSHHPPLHLRRHQYQHLHPWVPPLCPNRPPSRAPLGVARVVASGWRRQWLGNPPQALAEKRPCRGREKERRVSNCLVFAAPSIVRVATLFRLSFLSAPNGPLRIRQLE